MSVTEDAAATVYLKPGNLCLAERPTVVKTVLGSCVSVTMFSPRLSIGGICHAMLPRVRGGGGRDDFRYVDASIARMVRWFDERGVTPREIEVKLFGGATFREAGGEDDAPRDVGRMNVETALEILEAGRLAPSASDVGGNAGRKLFFLAHTGEVLLKRLGRMTGAERNCARGPSGGRRR